MSGQFTTRGGLQNLVWGFLQDIHRGIPDLSACAAQEVFTCTCRKQ